MLLEGCALHHYHSFTRVINVVNLLDGSYLPLPFNKRLEKQFVSGGLSSHMLGVHFFAKGLRLYRGLYTCAELHLEMESC